MNGIKIKIQTAKSQFNFRDFFGLSSLIFGLLLSNTSYNKSNANTPEPPKVEKQISHKIDAKKTIERKKKVKKSDHASI